MQLNLHEVYGGYVIVHFCDPTSGGRVDCRYEWIWSKLCMFRYPNFFFLLEKLCEATREPILQI